MRYQEYRPPATLAGLVHRVWTLEGPAHVTAEFQPAMSDGRPELIYNLGDPFERRLPGGAERQPLALLIGPTTRPMAVRPTGRIDLFGVRLRPGAWPALLGVRGDEVPRFGGTTPRRYLAAARELTRHFVEAS